MIHNKKSAAVILFSPKAYDSASKNKDYSSDFY